MPIGLVPRQASFSNCNSNWGSDNPISTGNVPRFPFHPPAPPAEPSPPSGGAANNVLPRGTWHQTVWVPRGSASRRADGGRRVNSAGTELHTGVTLCEDNSIKLELRSRFSATRRISKNDSGQDDCKLGAQEGDNSSESLLTRTVSHIFLSFAFSLGRLSSRCASAATTSTSNTSNTSLFFN